MRKHIVLMKYVIRLKATWYEILLAGGQNGGFIDIGNNIILSQYAKQNF